MSQIDYPDFIRVDQWVGDPFVSFLNQPVSDPHTYGPFFVGAWEALAFYLYALPGLASIVHTIDWWQDQGMTRHIFGQTIQGRNGNAAVDTFPVAGPWVSVLFKPGGANVTSSVILQPRRGLHSRSKLIDDLQLLHSANAVVGAGVSAVFPALISTSGRAMLHVSGSASAGWNATLDTVSSDGSQVARLAQLGPGANTPATTAEVLLNNSPVALTINNTSAGAITFGYSLTLDGSY